MGMDKFIPTAKRKTKQLMLRWTRLACGHFSELGATSCESGARLKLQKAGPSTSYDQQRHARMAVPLHVWFRSALRTANADVCTQEWAQCWWATLSTKNTLLRARAPWTTIKTSLHRDLDMMIPEVFRSLNTTALSLQDRIFAIWTLKVFESHETIIMSHETISLTKSCFMIKTDCNQDIVEQGSWASGTHDWKLVPGWGFRHLDTRRDSRRALQTWFP